MRFSFFSMMNNAFKFMFEIFEFICYSETLNAFSPNWANQMRKRKFSQPLNFGVSGNQLKINHKLFTHLWSDLVSTLTNLQVHNFSHDVKFPILSVAERLHNQMRILIKVGKLFCCVNGAVERSGSTDNHVDCFDWTEQHEVVDFSWTEIFL